MGIVGSLDRNLDAAQAPTQDRLDPSLTLLAHERAQGLDHRGGPEPIGEGRERVALHDGAPVSGGVSVSASASASPSPSVSVSLSIIIRSHDA